MKQTNKHPSQIGEFWDSSTGFVNQITYTCKCSREVEFSSNVAVARALLELDEEGIETRENWCNYCDENVTEKMKQAAKVFYGTDILMTRTKSK